MTIFAYILVWLGWLAVTVFTAGFLWTSIIEREFRAALLSCLMFLGLLCIGGIGILGLVFDDVFRNVFLVLGGVGCIIMPILFLIPFGKNANALMGTEGYISGEVKRFDERDQVFARNRSIRPGTTEYGKYYEQHPEWKEPDDIRREMGGPISSPAKFDGSPPHLMGMIHSSFITSVVLGNHEVVNPQPIPPMRDRLEKMMNGTLDAQKLTGLVKSYARFLGADDVGIARLDQRWIYSNRGEIYNEDWENWGKPIENNHPYAVMFTVEMDWAMTMTDPGSGAIVEGGLQYSRGAFISDILARFIASMGFEASADHFRHYNLMEVPVAVDAGLGEMGRFGYLISKKRGSRVRLSGVTTNLPLMPDKPVDMGVQHFCKVCKKCTNTCPGNAIPSDDEKTEHNGIRRWKLDEIKCYHWWGKVGSGCGICMRVCPYGHASTWPHNLIRFLVGRNPLSRYLLHLGDNIFYSSHPKMKALPGWLDIGIGKTKKEQGRQG